MDEKKTALETIRQQMIRDPTAGMELDHMREPSGLQKLEGVSYAEVYNFLSKMNISFQKESPVIKGRGKMILDRLVTVSREYASPLAHNLGPMLQDDFGSYYQATFKFESMINNSEYADRFDFKTSDDEKQFLARERANIVRGMGGGFIRLDYDQEKAFQHTYIAYKRYSLVKRITDVLKANFKFK